MLEKAAAFDIRFHHVAIKPASRYFHPFGAVDHHFERVAPAVGNAVLDACGARVNVAPVTPERVWRALRAEL